MAPRTSLQVDHKTPLRHQVIQYAADELRRYADPSRFTSEYEKYQTDPVRFGKEVLRENYTSDVRKMMESVRDNVVTFAQSSNGTGKSHGAARLATWFYKCFPGSQVWTAAAPPLENLKSILWGEIGQLTIDHPELFKNDDVSLSGLNIEGSPKHFIKGVAIPRSMSPEDVQARFSGKHAPYMLFEVDEGDAVPEAVYKGIDACMSGGWVRLIVFFNPRRTSGPIYSKQQKRHGRTVFLKAFNHPNVRTGENLIPGATDRETTVRRINMWSRPLASEETPDRECFKVPVFLEGVISKSLDGEAYPPLPSGYRKVTQPDLDTMVLARYPSLAVDQLISEDSILKAQYRWQQYVDKHGEIPPRGIRPGVGFDISDGGDLNAFQLKYGGWCPYPDIWNGVDVDLTAQKGAKLFKRYQALWVKVDGTGVGAGVAPNMNRNGCIAYKIMVQDSPVESEMTDEMKELGKFAAVRDQMLWLLREWLRKDPSAAIPPCELLKEEMLALTYGKDRLGRIKILDTPSIRERLSDKRSPDRLMAMALLFAPKPPLESSDLIMSSYA